MFNERASPRGPSFFCAHTGSEGSPGIKRRGGGLIFHPLWVDSGRATDYRDITVKILVIGSGGREHALVWRLRQSPKVEKIWCAPGNGGISAERLKPDMTVVGPEVPLVAGIRDRFESRGLRLIGPSRQHARLEGSKAYSKEFMQRHNIPTAKVYGIFDSCAKAIAAVDALDAGDWPIVVKADGLCGGKGVLVADTREEAADFIRRLMDHRELGEGGSRVLLEKGLKGEELSFIVLTDGKSYLPMAPTQDHKRVFDGDKGPNTGGMGAYTADGMISPGLEAVIVEKIVQPTIAGLSKGSLPYLGFLYFGLMLTAAGPMVLEYNCRLGDPETQPLMMRMHFDLAAAFEAVAARRLDRFHAAWKSGASVCIVMTSGGYPGACKTGEKIEGLDEVRALPDVAVFHAGTKAVGDSIVTNGGRVLGVTASAPRLDEAIRKAYDAAGNIHFAGAHYRKDIGAKAMSKTRAAGDAPRG